MTNILNRISEKASTTVKKQAKNITLASALIATLASCGNKAENTTPNQIDSTKVEKIDSIENKLDTTDTEDIELDFNLDGIEEEIKAQEEIEKKIPERQRLGFESEKGYKQSLEMIASSEETFKQLKEINYQRTPDMTEMIKDIVKNYKEQKANVEQPYSTVAKEVMKHLEAKK